MKVKFIFRIKIHSTIIEKRHKVRYITQQLRQLLHKSNIKIIIQRWNGEREIFLQFPVTIPLVLNVNPIEQRLNIETTRLGLILSHQYIIMPLICLPKSVN